MMAGETFFIWKRRLEMEAEGRKRQTGRREIDMLHGSLADKLFLFTVPLALSSILQQLFSSADLAVVGRFDSSQAMAAVGSNLALINMLISLFLGLSVGVNVVVAAMIGRGERDRIHIAVQTSMHLAFLCGFILLAVGQVIAPFVLRLVSTPDDVLPLAEEYLRIYFLGMPFFMTYNFGSAILRAKGDSTRPLYALIASGLLNVALNLLLVIVFHLGVAGVAIATDISNGLSAGMVLHFLMHEEDDFRFAWGRRPERTGAGGSGTSGQARERLARGDWLDRKIAADIFRIGAPAGLQGTVFALSNVVIQSGINSFGSACIAGNTAAQNFEFMSYFVVNASAQSAVTFTSQNFAAGNEDRCRKIYRYAMVLSMTCCASVSLLFFIFRYPLIGIFTADPEVVRYAMIRLYFIMDIEALTASYEIAGGCLRGMSHSLTPAVETVVGCCLFRIIWVSTVFRAHHTIETLMIVYVITWGITAAMVIPSYFITRKREFAKLGR